MNPEEIIAREASRLGRALSAQEKAAIRGGATSVASDGITATPLPVESSAERAAREARASAVERDRTLASTPETGGLTDWISDLPSTLRSGARSIRESRLGGTAIGAGSAGLADWIAEAADADDEEIRSRARSMASGAVEGATLGFGDELAGGVAMLGGGDYTTARDHVRERLRADREANPALFGGSALVTGMAMPIPGVGGATGGVTRATSAAVPTAARAIGSAARSAGTVGAIGAAGMSERDLATDATGLLGDIATGAGTSAALGTALAAPGAGLGAVARTRPAARLGADMAELAIPSGNPERLLREMNPRGASEAERVADAARRSRAFRAPLGALPSSAELAGRADEVMAGTGPSRPFEERLIGSSVPSEELAALLDRRAGIVGRSRVDADLAAPVAGIAERFRPPPAPAAPPAPRAPAPRAPAPAPAPRAPRAGRRAGGPPVPAAPIVPVRGRRPTMELPELTPETTRPEIPASFTDVGAVADDALPLPVEGTVPRIEDAVSLDGPGPMYTPEEIVGARRRIERYVGADDVPPADSLYTGTTFEEVPRHLRPGRSPAPEGPTGFTGAAEPTSTMSPAALEATGVSRVPARPPSPRSGGTRIGPAAAPPAPAPRVPRTAPAPAPVPGGRPRRHARWVPPDDGVPVYAPRPADEGPGRSARGSMLDEMRALRRRAAAAGDTAEADALWGAGADFRGRADEEFRRRFGDAEFADYLAARGVEEDAIPIGRDAVRGASRTSTPGGVRDAVVAHAASTLAGGGFTGAAAGLAASGLARSRGRAAIAGGRHAYASALESPLARRLASSSGEGTRRVAEVAGRPAAMTHPPAPFDRERYRREEPYDVLTHASELETAPPTGSRPASSPVPPPTGGATTSPTRVRSRWERYRRTP